MSYSQAERLGLAALLEETGPGAPTLCEGWTTTDLAAHLVLREHRPDAQLGMSGGPLAGYAAHAQRRLAERTPFARLVEMFRDGPPRMSVFALPGMDDRLNLAEYFVHHEDVRRAQPGWEPRVLGREVTEELWRRLRLARFYLRAMPVGVEFARDDVAGDAAEGRQLRMTVRNGTPVVTVVGDPAELMLWTYGRASVARVRMDGAESPVRALADARRRR